MNEIVLDKLANLIEEINLNGGCPEDACCVSAQNNCVQCYKQAIKRIIENLV